MDPVTGLLAISVGTRVAQSYEQIEAEKEQEATLDLQRKQSVLRHQQKTLANLDSAQKMIDSNLVSASARGVGLGSSSLEAIQRHTLDTAAKRQGNLDIEESIIESNIEAEKSNVRHTLFAELFGNAAGAASDFTRVKTSMPKGA